VKKISTDEVKSEPLRASRKSGTVAMTQNEVRSDRTVAGGGSMMLRWSVEEKAHSNIGEAGASRWVGGKLSADTSRLMEGTLHMGRRGPRDAAHPGFPLHQVQPAPLPSACLRSIQQCSSFAISLLPSNIQSEQRRWRPPPPQRPEADPVGTCGTWKRWGEG